MQQIDTLKKDVAVQGWAEKSNSSNFSASANRVRAARDEDVGTDRRKSSSRNLDDCRRIVSRQTRCAADILIGGSTDFDSDLPTWNVVVNEWTRTDAAYAVRIDHLFGTLSGGLNQIAGSYKYLNSSTLNDDGVVDDLYGMPGVAPEFAITA